MDDTHGTNSYDFHVTTVLVVDEFGEGYPVAWCLSNRTDVYVLIDFLQAIKHRVGYDIQPSWLMTDDAEQFYTAWTAVFGTKPHKLQCTWHVDRAWRKAIDKITDKEIGALTYYNLRVLMEETDKSKFEELLRKL